MKDKSRWLTAAGMLAAAFAGGAVSHSVLSSGAAALGARPARRTTVRPVTTSKVESLPTTAQRSQTVYARQVVLVDEKARRRAILGVSKGGEASLSLYDVKGRRQLTLAAREKGGASVSMFRESGGLFAALGEGRGLTMRDEKNVRRIELSPKGLLVNHESGKLGASYWSRHINFYNEDGKGSVFGGPPE
jgi:hypothetical protein